MTINILIITSFSFLFILWRTNSLQVSIATTVIISATFISSCIAVLGYKESAMLFYVLSLSTLVWRVIPHKKRDKWEKEERNVSAN